MGESIKEYLGDGVYAELTDYGDLVLTTSDGVCATNRIVLEPQVFQLMVEFISFAQAEQKRRWKVLDEENR